MFLHLGEGKVLRLPDDFSSTPRHGLVGELRVLLGPRRDRRLTRTTGGSARAQAADVAHRGAPSDWH